MTYIPFRLNDSVPEDCEIDGWKITFSKCVTIDDGGPGYEVAMEKDLLLIMFDMTQLEGDSAYIRNDRLRTMMRNYS